MSKAESCDNGANVTTFGDRLRRPLRGAGRHAPPGNFGMPQGGNSQPGTPTGAVRRRNEKTGVTSGRWSGWRLAAIVEA
ncbi:hypothetical protein [Bacteroides thetaiotaomicron]|uniref:hypothetical protein n=1 Tax=Bacteroides thetaiotaomicron TaxID=818 RepID=UPI001F434981|nr:hypothetical protein [Bacteroides thetaiotaomicron]MCE8781186.1 hypothetical protein [Bacteroides thetaiotaomicron]